MKKIKERIETNNLIITKAGKGKAIVILEQQKFKKYIQEFIRENNYTILQRNPTKQYQKKWTLSTEVTLTQTKQTHIL